MSREIPAFAGMTKLLHLKRMKIIGHRGARGLAPENTIAALVKAIDYGVDEVEFDVRVTSDHIAVLHHGKNLVDASGDHLAIAEHELAELLTHKPDLTKLDDAIATINHQASMYVEVKPGVDIKPIVSLLKAALRNGWQSEEITLGSFNYRILRDLHQALPELPIVVIESWSGVRAQYRARRLSTKLISMNQRWLWWGFIRAVSRGGYKLYAYTLNDPVKARRWAKFGLAGVITDFPDQFNF